MSHHRCRDAMPEAAAAAADQRQPQRLDSRAEQREHGRQEREPVQHRDRDDDRPGQPERGQERALVEEHPRQSDRDRQAGERDRATGGRERARQRLLRADASAQLLAEPAGDEERVVDRDAESDEGDDVERVLRDVGDARQQEDATKPTDDRQHADAEWQQRRDHGPEHEEQEQQRQGQ